jgi:hypothetical protein
VTAAERQRRYRATENARVKRAGLYRKWKSEGRCVNCGGRELSEGSTKCERCRDIVRRASREYYDRVRAETYEAYGGAVCVCCGETEQHFLTIDHVHNNGAEERREMESTRGSKNFYVRLKTAGFPSGYQVLCQNCNVGKFRNGGVCPHACGSKASD